MKYYLTANFLVLAPKSPSDLQIIQQIQTQLTFKRKIFDKFTRTYQIKQECPIITIKPERLPKLLSTLGHPFNHYYYLIPTGWIHNLQSQFNLNISPNTCLNYINPQDYFTNLPNLQQDPFWHSLRDYQKNAILTITNYLRGIIQIPTGGGKTHILIGILKALSPDKKALIIIPKSQTLLTQHLDTASKYFSKTEIGYYWSGGKKPGRLIFTTLNSSTIVPNLNEFDIMIIDECQTTPSSTILELINSMNNCYIKYGLSATPFGRSDELDFITIGILGNVVYSENPDSLQKQGFLSPIEKYVFVKITSDYLMLDNNQTIHVDDGLRYFNDYSTILDLFTNYSPKRLEVICQLTQQILNEGRNVLIIVDRVSFAEKLNESLRQFAQDQIALLHGKIANSERNRLLLAFKSGKLRILIATTLIEYGIDIPNLNTIILGTIGKSPIQLIQRLGRGLRKSEKPLIVYDIVELNNKVFYEHYRKRKRLILNTFNCQIDEIYFG